MSIKTTPFPALSSEFVPSTAEVVALTGEEVEELDAILDALRQHHEEVPQWEFCDGFMAALIVCRRRIPASEYWPVLLGEAHDRDAGADAQGHSEGVLDVLFTSPEQAQRFMDLWLRRWNHVVQCLSSEVDNLADEGAYYPEMLDVRGAIAALPEVQRQKLEGEPLPSFAQVWALGFMYAVENWPQEWQLPRDKEAAKHIDSAMQDIIALTEEDTGEPLGTVYEEGDAPAGMSQQRMDALGDAIWALYDLFVLWHEIGPRVETVHKEATPGRNEACFCGSGKKYKKCHGA